MRSRFFGAFVVAIVSGCAEGAAIDGPSRDAGQRDGEAIEDIEDADAPDARDDPDSSPGLEGGTDSSVVDGGCGGPLLINELRVESSASPLDQFVEIFNPNTCAVILSGYKLAYREAKGTADTALWVGAASDTIAAKGYFLVAGSSFGGAATRDGSLASTVFTRGGGGIGLYASGTLVDSLGWGSATNAFVRGSPAVSPSLSQSLARSPNGFDTQRNFDDFVARAAQSPRASN